MTEFQLLEFARSTISNQVAHLSQIITINFAMVVAIYYFLFQARLWMKIFAFIVYSFGMLSFLGQMAMEWKLRAGAEAALQALPQETLARPTAVYLDIADSSLNVLNAAVPAVAFWVLWIGMFALLFFWKRAPREADT